MNADPLVLAGDVAALLEEYGVVACGRKEDGQTRIDFWSHQGKGYRYAVTGEEETVSLLAICLQLAGIEAGSSSKPNPNWS